MPSRIRQLATLLRPLTTHTRPRFRPFHTISARPFPATTIIPATSTHTNTTNLASTNTAASSDANTGRHAAFLGEADSNDGFEVNYINNPPERAALDSTNAAYLGEADSDDGFEAHRNAHGRIEAVDASASAYLGEADSDDGHEGQVEVDPERFRHQLDEEAVRGSGAHGQPGEGDQ